MAEKYRFHEVRKGERETLLAFAARHGSAVSPDTLHHALSLVVENEQGPVAVALSTEPEPGHFVIEIVVGGQDTVPDLVTELADRCLRKVQARDIASARLHSPDPTPTDSLWSQTNWLERITETPPPDAADPGQPGDTGAESVQAA